MPGFLAEARKAKEQELEDRRLAASTRCLERLVQPATGRFRAMLAKGPALVAEIKPRSPSAGVIRASLDLDEVLPVFNRHADGISVLTDSSFFGGSFALMGEVTAKSPLPALCKDLIIDPHQIFEARLAGAEAVLLIVGLLSPDDLARLSSLAASLNLTPVVEVNNERELEVALEHDAEVILINNRNLDTFEVDLQTTARLAPLVPRETPVISASGICSTADIKRLLPYACRFLVGQSLMQAPNLELTAGELRRAIGAGFTRVKICGLTNREDASAAAWAGADFLGFVFAGSSPRAITPENARSIVARPFRETAGRELPKPALVGVFKDQPLAYVNAVADYVGLDYIQYHGNETPTQCLSSNRPVIKSLAVTDPHLERACNDYRMTSHLLFDSPKHGPKIELCRAVAAISSVKSGAGKFFFAGGLDTDNVSAVVRDLEPHGVDAASRLEQATGKKDHELVRLFVRSARGEAT